MTSLLLTVDPSQIQFIIIETLAVLGFLAFLLFWWADKLPSADTLGKVVAIANTKGGNILILLALSLFGMFMSVRMLYYLVQLSVDGKLAQDNSFALLAIAFITNTITGAFIGALLKTLGGEEAAKEPPK